MVQVQLENFTNRQSVQVQVDRKVAEVEFYAEPTASIDKPTTVYWSVLNKCKG